jgi:hypothetical protein
MNRLTLHLVLMAAAVILTPGASAKKPPPPPATGGGSTTSTYVKNYANVLNGVQYNLTPEDVQATPDGGWIGLASTDSPPAQPGSGVGPPVGWLLKASAVGAPQWQEEVGCFGLAPGYYSIPVSLQRTSDGGFVLAGGSLGCGSGGVCTSGYECALIERLDAAGGLLWAQAYNTAETGAGIEQIKETSDGGFVAVGNASDLDHNTGGLILKLDGAGNIQWQRRLGPTGSKQAYFNAVEQTSDGGYVAVGELTDGTTWPSGGTQLQSVLSVKLDSMGNVTWQRAFNGVGASGVADATEHALAIVQASDGGYAIAGNWTNSNFPGECCAGALLLKLTASGSIQWQKAYSGGVSCGYQSCSTLSGIVYSLHQGADGGYLLAGAADDPQLVPWLAKVDGSGTLVWQESDYQVNTSTGRPLSEYFASSAVTPVGLFAMGSTENYSNGLNELLGVQTDANGNAGACAQIHMDSALNAIDPGLAELTPDLTTATRLATHATAPVETKATSVSATVAQC